MKKEYLQICEQFEVFLASIPLETYRNELMQIKTVERDLPSSLNPLTELYLNTGLLTSGRPPSHPMKISSQSGGKSTSSL